MAALLTAVRQSGRVAALLKELEVELASLTALRTSAAVDADLVDEPNWLDAERLAIVAELVAAGPAQPAVAARVRADEGARQREAEEREAIEWAVNAALSQPMLANAEIRRLPEWLRDRAWAEIRGRSERRRRELRRGRVVSSVFDLDQFAPPPTRFKLGGRVYVVDGDPDVDVVARMMRIEQKVASRSGCSASPRSSSGSALRGTQRALQRY
jgi:hypothetical protein